MQGCVSPQPHTCTHSSEGLGSLAGAHFKTIYQWLSESKRVQRSQWIKSTYMKTFAQLCPRDTVGTGGNTFDFRWYCSPHPTFLLRASHPACKPQPPLITRPRLQFAINCFLHSPFFFTDSDQENVWERRLPIGAGEWHPAVRVSTPPVSGTPLQSATRAVVCFPRGLDFCVSVADISQTDLRLGRPRKVAGQQRQLWRDV